MKIEGYLPQKEFDGEVKSEDIEVAIRRFKLLYGKDLIISYVDEREVEGRCEGCERHIFHGEKYGHDPEGMIIVCPECVEKENAAKTAH